MVNFCDRFVDLCVIDFSVGILILPLPLDVIDFMIVVYYHKNTTITMLFPLAPVQKTSKSLKHQNQKTSKSLTKINL